MKSTIILTHSLLNDGVGSLSKSLLKGLSQKINIDVKEISFRDIFNFRKIISQKNNILILPGKSTVVYLISYLIYPRTLLKKNTIIVIDSKLPLIMFSKFFNLKQLLNGLIYSFFYFVAIRLSNQTVFSYNYAAINSNSLYLKKNDKVIYHPTKASESCKTRIKIYDFMWAGRFAVEKNPMMFLRQIRNIIEANINVSAIILGEGPLKKEVIEFILENNLSKHVEYVDKVEDLSEFYCQTNCVVSTSQIEACSMILKESLKCSCDIICSNTFSGGPKELVDNYGGFLFDPKNEGELFNLMCDYLSQTENLKNKIKSIKPNSYSINEYYKLLK